MLYIYFKRNYGYDDILTEENYRIQPSLWFDFQGGSSYIQGTIERSIIADIDKGEVLDIGAIKFPIVGIHAPDCLSSTAKTLILANNEPGIYVNGDFVGNNGLKWLLTLAEDKDIYLRAGAIMKFHCDFSACIINDGSTIESWSEFVNKGVDFLHAGNTHISDIN